MKIWVCSIIFALFCGCSTDALQRVCPGECPYPFEGNHGREIHANVGICDRGTPVCDENVNIIECEGQVLPEWEICDGLDNDCDGRIDEFMQVFRGASWSFYGGLDGSENPCGYIKGECGQSWIHCKDEWVCDLRDTVELPHETSCDGLDNDCDGRIDEDIYFVGEFCYEVPNEDWWTASNDPCRPGTYACEDGKKACLGQILPQDELCDLIDNDCNGVIDDTGQTLQEVYDIVFLIDTSGSMFVSIEAVAIAFDMYSTQFVGNPNYRFAIVEFAADTPGFISVVSDFEDLSVIHAILINMVDNGSMYEASLDTPYYVCDVGLNPLSLSWLGESQKIFMEFTDEMAQSYAIPEITADDVVDMCVDNDVVGYIWSYTSTDFNLIAIGTGGIHFRLSTDPSQMFADLNSIIEDMCVD